MSSQSDFGAGTAADKPAPAADRPATSATAVSATTGMAPTIYIVYYSMYGHVYKLAKEVQAGLESEGVNVKLFQARPLFTTRSLLPATKLLCEAARLATILTDLACNPQISNCRSDCVMPHARVVQRDHSLPWEPASFACRYVVGRSGCNILLSTAWCSGFGSRFELLWSRAPAT